jgi:hypothetical protein
MEQAEMDLEVKEHREAQREAIIFKTLRHTMNVLAIRGLRYLALLLTAVFFGIAIAEPDPWRTGTACAFAVLVFLPILFRKGGGDGPTAG